MTTQEIIDMLTSMQDEIDNREVSMTMTMPESYSKSDLLRAHIRMVRDYWLGSDNQDVSLKELRSAAIAALDVLVMGLYKTRKDAPEVSRPTEYA